MPGQADVEQHQVEWTMIEERECRGSIAGRFDVWPAAVEQRGQCMAQGPVVVDDRMRRLGSSIHASIGEPFDGPGIRVGGCDRAIRSVMPQAPLRVTQMQLEPATVGALRDRARARGIADARPRPPRDAGRGLPGAGLGVRRALAGRPRPRRAADASARGTRLGLPDRASSRRRPRRRRSSAASACRAGLVARGAGMDSRRHRDENFPRAAVADRVGLHAAFALPIMRDDVLGVMEFFSREIRQPRRICWTR